jgi:hypothetical protein
MKVTNRTAYATIGCDVQLSENDRLALGIELDKITNWLETVIGDESEVAESLKAVNKIVAFVSKFAIRPSETNVFTDSPLDFKKADETTTAVEPVPDNSVITVDISKSKDVKNLIKIIYNATDANRNNILDLLNSATHLHIPNISFKYPHMSESEIVDNLVSAGYKIVPNTVKSLQLETYMPNSDKD